MVRMKEEDLKRENGGMPTMGERSIWKFYEWAVIVAPILLMLSHWYIFYVFSQNSHELLRYSEANEICIAWIYSILYLYIPLMILPATYFFRWCNLFRVPFVYFIFINVERWYYGSWFCTNEMVDTHYILIFCICGIYVMELVELLWRNIFVVVGKIKKVAAWVSCQLFSTSEEDERKMDEIVTQMKIEDELRKNKQRKNNREETL